MIQITRVSTCIFVSMFIANGLFPKVSTGIETRRSMEDEVTDTEMLMVMGKLITLRRDQVLTDELEMTDSQVELLETMGMSFLKEKQILDAESRELLWKAKESLRKNNKDEQSVAVLTEIRQKHRVILENYMEQLEDVLVPRQIARLLELVRQDLGIRSSKMGDEFGLFLTIAKKLDLSSSEIAVLEKKIGEIRDDYYQKVDALKLESFREVEKAMPTKESRVAMKELLEKLRVRSK